MYISVSCRAQGRADQYRALEQLSSPADRLRRSISEQPQDHRGPRRQSWEEDHVRLRHLRVDDERYLESPDVLPVVPWATGPDYFRELSDHSPRTRKSPRRNKLIIFSDVSGGCNSSNHHETYRASI